MARLRLDAIPRLWRRFKGYAVFGQRVEIFGDFKVLGSRNIRLGNNVAINHGVFLMGRSGIEIGDNVVLSARCMILDAGLDPESFATDRIEYLDGPVKLGARAWIGAGAIILPGVTIGDGAIIGAGAVVTRDVPMGEIWAGNPAQRIQKRPAGIEVSNRASSL